VLPKRNPSGQHRKKAAPDHARTSLNMRDALELRFDDQLTDYRFLCRAARELGDVLLESQGCKLDSFDHRQVRMEGLNQVLHV